MVIKCDNKGALDLSKNAGFNDNTKHIDIKHNYLKEKVDSGFLL